MKALLLFGGIALAGCAGVRDSISPLRATNTVQGAAIGYAGTEGSFSVLYRAIESRASDQEVKSMMADSHPAVRLMGYVVALLRWPEQRAELIAQAKEDSGEIILIEGCDLVGEKMTVASVIEAEEKLRGEKLSLLIARK